MVLLSGWALLCGLLLAGIPKLAVALLAAGVVLTLALRAPVTLLLLLLALTAIVPYEIQHPYAIGASASSPGLLLSDALLLAGLFRAILVLPQMPLDRRRTIAVGVMVCFVVVVGLQAMRGLMLGASLSVIGAEFRHLIGFATLLIAIPILDDPRSRRNLLGCLLALGLALGLWGLAQWVLHLEFGIAGDVGVRSGVSLTTSGSGQLQGGLFGFPVAALLALAALVSGAIRSGLTRAVVVAVLLTNLVDVLLTFERTVWIATLIGAILVLARAGRTARGRALKWSPLVLGVVVVGLLLSPGTFTTASQRLLSIGRYSSDNSVRYRLIESEHVLAKIRAHPLTGSALGATIYWGRPYDGVPPKAYNYSHDGYLWLSWKLGLPAAVLLVGLMLAAVFWRGPPDAEPLVVAVRQGAQAALAALLIVSATFPVFNSLEISCVVGVLLALAAMPRTLAVHRPAPPAAGAEYQPAGEGATLQPA
jgi:hypothetical protein